MQHGRFAGAVRADQTQRLAAPDAKIELMQDFHLAIARTEIVNPQMRLMAGQRVELFDVDITNDRQRLARDLIDGYDGADAAVIAAAPLGLVGRHQCAPR